MDGSRSDPTVDDFVAVKASKSHKVQRTSTSGPQQVQYQSVKNYKIPQRSIGNRIWFGTRGSEVQILSPRPFLFNKASGTSVLACLYFAKTMCVARSVGTCSTVRYPRARRSKPLKRDSPWPSTTGARAR